MVIIIQELEIEGPLARLRGAKEGRPLSLQSIEPRLAASSENNTVDNDHEDGPPHQVCCDSQVSEPNIADIPDPQHHSSVLRQGTRTSRTSKAPTEPVSDMSKRLEFSLGTKGIEAGDIISAFNDREPLHVPKPSRSPAKVRENNDSSGFVACTTSHEASSHLGRGSTESQMRFRHTQSVHRNRFFGKEKAMTREGVEVADMMEQGMAGIPENDLGMAHMDPRSGTISPRAVRDDT